MPFCVHCGKKVEGSSKLCPGCGKAPTGRGPVPAAAIAFGLVGFFVAAGAVSLHLKKGTPPNVPEATVVPATPLATATPTPSVSATPTENLFAGTWTGEPNEKGDRITLVVEAGPLPAGAHYQVTMKDGGDYRRANLTAVPNEKHPTDQIDGLLGSEPYFRVGIDKGEMYGWVEVIRSAGTGQPEQPEFAGLHRSGDPEAYVDPLVSYGVPEYSDASTLGTWDQEIEGVASRTYGYTSKASLEELQAFYEEQLPKVETLHAEKGECKLRFQGEGDAVTIQIVDNDTSRRVEISKPADAPQPSSTPN